MTSHNTVEGRQSVGAQYIYWYIMEVHTDRGMYTYTYIHNYMYTCWLSNMHVMHTYMHMSAHYSVCCVQIRGKA